MILSLAFLVPCSRLSGNEGAGKVVPQDCFDAVKKALGPGGHVAKYGHLIGHKSIEVVAYTRIKKFKQNSEGVPISKLVVLQKNNSRWDAVLNVSKDASKVEERQKWKNAWERGNVERVDTHHL
jgi:hypothetical protein